MNNACKSVASGRRQRGVTLIELMTVVAIIAVIATIAIPTYRRYLIRSQRSEAKIALLQLQTAQEKFYLQNNSFASNANIATASPAGLGLSNVTETGKYDLAITAFPVDGQTYTATASPRTGGGQTDDTQCGSFTITERGVKGASGPYGAVNCWR